MNSTGQKEHEIGVFGVLLQAPWLSNHVAMQSDLLSGFHLCVYIHT